MAMNPDDTKLRNGLRAPTNRINPRGEGAVLARQRSFKHTRLSDALAGFGVPKVRVR